jgi:RHS repeat-associated protein
LTSSVQVRDSSNTLKRQADYTWGTTGFPPVSTVLSNIVTTLSDTGQQSKVAYGYDPWANITDVYEYDFGLTLKRHTVTSYLTTGDYVTFHVVDLPTQVLVKDSGDNTIARTDIAYDGGTLTSITGAANHDDQSYSSSFTTRGNATSVTRYANAAAGTGGITRNFTYDSLGNLTSAQLDCCSQKVFNFSTTTQYSFPDSITRGPTGTQFTTSYTYDPDNSLLLTSTDENSQTVQYQYDAMGRTTQFTLPPQNGTKVVTTTVYGDDTVSPTVTTSSATDTGGSVPTPVTVATFDGLGHIMQVDTKNGSTGISSVQYAYDKIWQRTQASNPYAPGGTIVNTTSSYDALGRVTQVAPPSGGSTQYSYSGNAVTITDPTGKQRKNITDGLGHMIEVDEPGGGSPSTAASGSMTINGTLRSWTGSAQSATSGHIEMTFSGTLKSKSSCSPSGQPCTDNGSISITVGGFTKSAAYSSSTGTDSGQTVHALATAFHLDSTSPVDAIYYGADESGNIIMDFIARAKGAATNYPLSISIVSANPANFAPPSFQVSAGSSLIGGQDASSGGTIYDSGIVYVSVGSFTASAPYSHSGNNSAAMIATALAGTGSTGLNQSSSPVTATVSGATITVNYKTTGAAGNVYLGFSSSTANPDTPSFSGTGSTLTGGADTVPPTLSTPAVTLYAYDVLDNLTQVTQGTQTRNYVYDSLSRVTSSTTPESGTANTYYTNASGNACSGDPSLACRAQDARGIVKTFTYDGINRPAGVSYSDSTPSVAYTYDTGGSAAFALNRLTKITEGPPNSQTPNSQTLTYDNLGRISSVAQVIDSTTYTTQYSYNLANQLTSITYPTGRVVAQNVDNIGRLSSIASGGTNYLSGLSYNAAGETLALTLGNNVQGVFGYNDHLQVSSLRYFKSGSSTDILNLGYDYGSNNNGQIQAVHYYTSPGVEDPTKSEYFNYDPLARLSSANTGTVNSTPGTWSLQWGYDRWGNRLSQTLIGGNVTIGQPQLTIDPATNRITNSGVTYDANGNLTNDGVTAYSYDGANRVTQLNSGSASYTYFGPLRIKKVIGSTTTVYIYSGNKPITEYVNGNLSREYIYDGSFLLATVSGGAATYHHPDHLSNRAETDGSGNVVRTYGHYPFGETWYETGTADKWKFTTYENDSAVGESGLNYAQFRYHAPGFGRFMSADPLGGTPGIPQSLNRYSYVHNDPVNFTDPLGLSDEGPPVLKCVVNGGVFWGDFCEFLWDTLFRGGGGDGGGEVGGGGGGPSPEERFKFCKEKYGTANAKNNNLTFNEFNAAQDAANKAGISTSDVLAIWDNETGFDADNYWTPQANGDVGPLQITPATRDDLDRLDELPDNYDTNLQANVLAGATYYSVLLNHYHIPSDGAAAAYQTGEHRYKRAAARAKKSGKPIKLFKKATGYQKNFNDKKKAFDQLVNCIKTGK